MSYCIYAVIIWIKILTWCRAPKSRGRKKIILRMAIISTDIYEHVHKQIIYLKEFTHVYVRIRGKHKQAKKRAALRVQKYCAWVPRVGFEPTIVSLEDAKRKGLNDLVESVQLDVMDVLDGQNLTYLNASQPPKFGGGRDTNFVINLVYPIVIQRNIVVIQWFSTPSVLR